MAKGPKWCATTCEPGFSHCTTHILPLPGGCLVRVIDRPKVKKAAAVALTFVPGATPQDFGLPED